MSIGRVWSALLLLCLATPLTAEAQMIIAHRGASEDAPENTLAAFELAWEQGAHGIEADFHLTRDGHVVCIHDRTTGRTADADLVVAESTLEQLKELDVGSWKDARFAGERIPTLAEVLEVVPADGTFFIEIKSGPETVAPVKEALEEASLEPDQTVVISFHADVIAETRRRIPQIRAYWLVHYRQDEQTGEWTPGLERILRTLRRIDAHGLNTHGNRQVVDGPFVAALREAGMEFHTWTINDPALAAHFQDLGADSITTDRPGAIRRHLEGRGSGDAR